MACVLIRPIAREQRTEINRNSSKMYESTLKTVRKIGKIGRTPIRISADLHTPAKIQSK